MLFRQKKFGDLGDNKKERVLGDQFVASEEDGDDRHYSEGVGGDGSKDIQGICLLAKQDRRSLCSFLLCYLFVCLFLTEIRRSWFGADSIHSSRVQFVHPEPESIEVCLCQLMELSSVRPSVENQHGKRIIMLKN